MDTHTLTSSRLTYQGFTFNGGFGSGNVIEFNRVSDLGSITIGDGGSAIYNLDLDETMEMTIIVQESSEQARILSNLMQQQRAGIRLGNGTSQFAHSMS